MQAFPLIMGVVNVTPDSFSDGGKLTTTRQAVTYAMQLVGYGADLLDVGGESTRPGAQPVDVATELERVIPVIEGIRSVDANIPISIDTMKADVAREAVAAGATIVNDVSAGMHDAQMFGVVAAARVPMILMHMQGEPRTMQQSPTYTDVVQDVATFLEERVVAAAQAGVRDTFVDPGIGFGKTLEHNLELLRNLDVFARSAPVVLGISRKRFLGALTGIDSAGQRDIPTALMHALLLHQPVTMIRVHHVQILRQLRTLWEAFTGRGTY